MGPLTVIVPSVNQPQKLFGPQTPKPPLPMQNERIMQDDVMNQVRD